MPVQDLAELAAGLGMSESSVAVQFAGQTEFVLAASAAFERNPKIYFSSGWTPERLMDGGYKGWIAFSERPAASEIALLDKLPIPVELRFDAPGSVDELDVIRHEVMESLVEILPELAGMTGDFTERGVLEVQYELAASSHAADASHPLDITSLQEIARRAPIDVEVWEASNIAPREQVVRGGVSFGTCTLGFAAIRGGSQRGGVTAGHCSNTAQTPPGSSISMPFVLEHVGAYGDVQFHSTTDTISREINIGQGGRRNITSVAYPTNGMSVCNYGRRRTNFSCTTIRNWNHAFYNGNGVWLSRMAQSNGSFTLDGDSGGPWWHNNTGIGVHYGKSGGYSTMSRLPDVESILSVRFT